MSAVTADSPAAPAPEAKKPGRLRRSWDKHWYAWAFITPVVLVMVVIILWPLIQGIFLSFTDATEKNVAKVIGGRQIPATYDIVGLKNYIDVLTSSTFWVIFARTVVWTVVNVFFHFTLGLILALVLNRALTGRALYRALLIVPWAVPAFVSTYMWRLMLTDNGLVNSMFGAVGLPAVPWLSDTNWLFISCILVNIWLGVPFMMVALLGGLQSIPNELYEAAEVDGATPWQRFKYVTVPGLRTVAATVILLGSIWTFNMFAIIYLMAAQGQRNDIATLPVFAYDKAFTGIRQYAVSSTYGVLILSILLVFAIFYRRALAKQGEVW
ncbi:MAG: sugar ABC transporter permease [Candidatus Nanopelagicales bacterium]|jgi:arabinogalactan oligomer/maltooligosaccharide transport system permease protein|nr:sugar ABC transporter permease [Candidatus Nanopelagicales bacterium]MCU0295195.1 sugar ABC transporter permease [Candidatus Nanopelagicales bacterium]MCU0297444.1 sugar ABC transporter permease [Candidatus Nanopelagicales bacterium]